MAARRCRTAVVPVLGARRDHGRGVVEPAALAEGQVLAAIHADAAVEAVEDDEVAVDPATEQAGILSSTLAA
jgi:hypothetical protein